MRKLFVSAIVLLSLWNLSEAQTNYCNICRDHTMCRYPDKPSPNCNRVLRAEVPKEDIKAILDMHNAIRKRVASGNETSGRPGPLPPAGDMQILTWDDELAKIALRWAMQCKPAPDTCRNVERFNVGQNIYYYKCRGCTHDRPDWQSAIYSWYKTVQNLPKYSISPYHYSSEYGPYTQLVWSTTMTVGCAYISYISSDNYWVTRIFICNYGPTGNIVGPQTQVYGVGRPCSWCQDECQDDLLCNFPTEETDTVVN